MKENSQLQKEMQKGFQRFWNIHTEVFYRIVLFKNFVKFTGKYFCQSLVCDVRDKVTYPQPKTTLGLVFLGEFCETFQNTIFWQSTFGWPFVIGSPLYYWTSDPYSIPRAGYTNKFPNLIVYIVLCLFANSK